MFPNPKYNRMIEVQFLHGPLSDPNIREKSPKNIYAYIPWEIDGVITFVKYRIFWNVETLVFQCTEKLTEINDILKENLPKAQSQNANATAPPEFEPPMATGFPAPMDEHGIVAPEEVLPEINVSVPVGMKPKKRKSKK